MKYNVTLNKKVYEVEVERGEAILVSVAAQAMAPIAAAAAPLMAAVAPVAAAPAAPTAGPLQGEAIKSPMPGTIIKVTVSPGDMVKAGQNVVVLEAMKMESDIPAPRDGKVMQVLVSKGSTVDTGTPLLTLA